MIECLEHASIAATGELMRHPDVALVLATGGPGMVRAAYSSGKPTLAVGAGNVPGVRPPRASPISARPPR